jgi:hypothetical protein
MDIMDKELTTVKIWKLTRRLSKILAAHYDIPLVKLIHKLVTDEIKRKGLSIE